MSFEEHIGNVNHSSSNKQYRPGAKADPVMTSGHSPEGKVSTGDSPTSPGIPPEPEGNVESDWARETDPNKRRRIQNKLAQRKFRQ